MTETSTPEYLYRKGYELLKFQARFTESHSFHSDLNSKDKFPLSVDCQFLFCIANDVEKALVMIDNHYQAQGIKCKEIWRIEPITTKNSDIQFLNKPQEIIGFQDGIILS